MYAEVKAADTEYPPFLSATPFQERRGVSGSGLALREHPGIVGFPDAVKRAFHTAVVKQVNTGVSKTLVAPHGLISSGVLRVRVPSAALFQKRRRMYGTGRLCHSVILPEGGLNVLSGKAFRGCMCS